ncbi:unnamed protein product [Durusdinium trenchii]|uniref:Reverse transcriptase domain-containing protein n=1 Tax=Durusdinium trenchii TaxID=1381693 RepID=A0ABP0RWA8_9DINO
MRWRVLNKEGFLQALFYLEYDKKRRRKGDQLIITADVMMVTEMGQANGEKVATYKGTMQVGTWGTVYLYDCERQDSVQGESEKVKTFFTLETRPISARPFKLENAKPWDDKTSLAMIMRAAKYGRRTSVQGNIISRLNLTSPKGHQKHKLKEEEERGESKKSRKSIWSVGSLLRKQPTDEISQESHDEADELMNPQSAGGDSAWTIDLKPLVRLRAEDRNALPEGVEEVDVDVALQSTVSRNSTQLRSFLDKFLELNESETLGEPKRQQRHWLLQRKVNTSSSFSAALLEECNREWKPTDWQVMWHSGKGPNIKGQQGQPCISEGQDVVPLMEAEFRRDCVVFYNTLFPSVDSSNFQLLRDIYLSDDGPVRFRKAGLHFGVEVQSMRTRKSDFQGTDLVSDMMRKVMSRVSARPMGKMLQWQSVASSRRSGYDNSPNGREEDLELGDTWPSSPAGHHKEAGMGSATSSTNSQDLAPARSPDLACEEVRKANVSESDAMSSRSPRDEARSVVVPPRAPETGAGALLVVSRRTSRREEVRGDAFGFLDMALKSSSEKSSQDWHKLHALLAAKVGSVQTGCFGSGISSGCCQCCCRALYHHVLPLGGRDGQIKRSRGAVEVSFPCRAPRRLSNNAGRGGNISAANLSGLDGPCGGKDWEKPRTGTSSTWHPRRQREGQVPQQWLTDNNRQRCMVCGLSVSVRSGVHPTARAAFSGSDAGRAAAALTLPSLDELQSAQGRALRHIPAAARFLWGQALGRAFAAAAHHNDLRTWTELLMLPQCVLSAPPRAGRRHSLWDDAGRPPGGPKPRLSVAKKRELAIDLAREGFDRKACNALLQNGLCPETADTVAALRALHPAQPKPRLDLASLPLADEISEDLVARALRSFPADTAPGPSGLRVQHLREAGAPGTTHSLVAHLARLVNLMAQSQVCPAIAPVLAGAGLVAFPKPNRGVRPIAVGEILRRLTGKCLMQTVQEDARRAFWPTQLGVGIKSGAEIGIHTVRAWTQRNGTAANKVLLDFANAFNRISRHHVLESATVQFPGLARWVTWCYQEPSALRFGTAVISSAGGVQQGDPLGPLLFATAIHQLTQELRAGPLDLALFYLDDGIIAGDVAAVGAALGHIQSRGAALGLALNAAKCEVVAVGQLQHADLVPHLLSEILSGCDGSSRLQRDFEFLGGAIGGDAFVDAHTKGRVEAVGPLLDALAALGDAQVGLHLLRSCAGYGRLVHSMRRAHMDPEDIHVSLDAKEAWLQAIWKGSGLIGRPRKEITLKLVEPVDDEQEVQKEAEEARRLTD